MSWLTNESAYDAAGKYVQEMVQYSLVLARDAATKSRVHICCQNLRNTYDAHLIFPAFGTLPILLYVYYIVERVFASLPLIRSGLCAV